MGIYFKVYNLVTIFSVLQLKLSSCLTLPFWFPRNWLSLEISKSCLCFLSFVIVFFFSLSVFQLFSVFVKSSCPWKSWDLGGNHFSGLNVIEWEKIWFCCNKTKNRSLHDFCGKNFSTPESPLATNRWPTNLRTVGTRLLCSAKFLQLGWLF